MNNQMGHYIFFSVQIGKGLSTFTLKDGHPHNSHARHMEPNNIPGKDTGIPYCMSIHTCYIMVIRAHRIKTHFYMSNFPHCPVTTSVFLVFPAFFTCSFFATRISKTVFHSPHSGQQFGKHRSFYITICN